MYLTPEALADLHAWIEKHRISRHTQTKPVRILLAAPTKESPRPTPRSMMTAPIDLSLFDGPLNAMDDIDSARAVLIESVHERPAMPHGGLVLSRTKDPGVETTVYVRERLISHAVVLGPIERGVWEITDLNGNLLMSGNHGRRAPAPNCEAPDLSPEPKRWTPPEAHAP